MDIDQILVAALGPEAEHEESFIGHMSNFEVNGYKFFELLGDLPDGVTIHNTGQIGDKESPIPIHKVTFQSPIDSYLTLTTLHIGDNFDFEFMFKTKEKNGLLFYNAGINNEFFAMELLNGIVHLVYNDGTGPKMLAAQSPKMNDNEWHHVKLSRTYSKNFEVTIDDRPTQFPSGTRQDHLNLAGTLYVGGVPKAMYGNSLPEQITSQHGFKGCMASVRIAKRLVDLIDEATSMTSYIKTGCTGRDYF